MIWIIANADEWIRRLFPRPNWDEELGWLQLRAERKARALLRWWSYAVHGLFAILLLGITWSSVAVGRWADRRDTDSLREMVLRLPVLAMSLALCFGYVAAELLPRLRREFDEEELVRFRSAHPDMETEKSRPRSSRLSGGMNLLPGTRKRERRR